MPTSTRKSSLGNLRRGPQKAHIPYRGDNPEVGKKTGIAVQHVERKSDGFEPFDELIQAADGLTPPQRKARKNSLAAGRLQDDYDDDEDGEQSMQIDSPVQHLVNLLPPISPPTLRRKSSIRPIARTSDVDFDRIPSPRPISSLHKSLVNGGGPGPSTLSQSRSYREPESLAPTTDDGGEYDGGGGDGDQTMFDDHGREEDTLDRGTTSFSQIDQDDEEEEEEEEDHEPTPKPTRQQKGKGKDISRQEMRDQDEEMENEIAQGLDGVELESDASQEMPPVKRSKSAAETGGRKGNQSKKENRVYREGTRRSKRKPLKPLAFWRGERYVYGRPEGPTGRVLVPPIREVIRIPEEPVKPLGGVKRKRGTSRARSRSRGKVEPNEDVIPPALPVENPEEGWDDATDSKCLVLHFKTQEEVERRVAWTAKMVEPKMSTRDNWSFDKVFNDDDFIAAGQLVIPPKGRKPSKQAKDNTYVFYVIEGAVNFKIHNTSMVMATGGMFMVPRGNNYFIENICNRDARLFFTQARKLDMNDDEKVAKGMHDTETQRRRVSGRSSSAGITPSKKIHTPTRARATSQPSP